MELAYTPHPNGDAVDVHCHNCGSFRLSGSLSAVLAKGDFSKWERARLSYGLRRRGDAPLLTTDLAASILRGTELPDASSLRDNLLMYVASDLPSPGERISLQAIALRAAIGALSSTSVCWAVEQALDAQLLEGVPARAMNDDDYSLVNATLTVRGWARVEELLREAKGANKAFMAMKFGDSQLDAVFRQHFKPAVHQAGFDLVRLDDEPRAGLIDDRLRLEIRTSRFLLADLSHANAGAYWEAGFAEGLGRPVIYTCRKDVFDNPATKPHFDTNHHLTVVWDLADPAAAAEQLKTVIRVTLPTEAKLEDSP